MFVLVLFVFICKVLILFVVMHAFFLIIIIFCYVVVHFLLSEKVLTFASRRAGSLVRYMHIVLSNSSIQLELT